MRPMENEVAAMADELERARRTAEEVRRKVSEITHKATSKNKILTVTVGGQGDLQKLEFRGEAYRSLAPAELSKLIVETVAKARKASQAQAMAGIREVAPQAAMPLDFLKESTSMDEFIDNILDVAARYLPEQEISAPPRSSTGEENNHA